MTLAPAALRLLPFGEACTLVVQYLKDTVPLAFWSVSHFDGDRQVYVCVQDDAYGKVEGGSHPWPDSFCQYMVAGATPQIAPDAMEVPEYAAAGVARTMTIGAYVGVPIRDGDGKLYGTLCGLDPAVQSRDLLAHAPLMHLLAALLGQILHADRMRIDAFEREAQLHWSAFHDQLTGLPNRAMFLDRVGHALDLNHRDRRPLAVLLLDLDDFKAVNDSLGHAWGDHLLVRVAERLRGALRPGDTLARLSGDEFAVLLEDGADPAALAGRAVRALGQPFVVGGTRITVSASVGVAELPAGDEVRDPDTNGSAVNGSAVNGSAANGSAANGSAAEVVSVDTMLARADVAMYSAKRAGKGRFALYHPVMTLPGTRDLQLREHLRRAIDSGAVEAVYQPIVELGGGRVVAFEALARWQHEGRMIGPDVFVPIAARSGLLPALTDHMLELAAAQLARWSARLGQRDLRVSVNVPPCRISDPEFPGRVAACIRRHGLAPEQLVLEITEDALLTDPPAARVGAHQLHEVGATLSLDDFGTGYSSLLHLQQIPLHSVKIDRGFTSDLDTNPDTERFMRALLALGRDLGLRVIVEGVERSAQADVLHRLGCTHAQGHLFGHPSRPQDIRIEEIRALPR